MPASSWDLLLPSWPSNAAIPCRTVLAGSGVPISTVNGPGACSSVFSSVGGCVACHSFISWGVLNTLALLVPPGVALLDLGSLSRCAVVVSGSLSTLPVPVPVPVIICIGFRTSASVNFLTWFFM